jgi:hypothetical protein
MTVSSTGINLGRYFQIGKLVFFTLRFVTTTGGSASIALTFTLPVERKNTEAYESLGQGFTGDGNKGVYVLANNTSTTTAIITKYDSSNFSLAAMTTEVSGFYEAA